MGQLPPTRTIQMVPLSWSFRSMYSPPAPPFLPHSQPHPVAVQRHLGRVARGGHNRLYDRAGGGSPHAPERQIRVHPLQQAGWVGGWVGGFLVAFFSGTAACACVFLWHGRGLSACCSHPAAALADPHMHRACLRSSSSYCLPVPLADVGISSSALIFMLGLLMSAFTLTGCAHL